MINQYLTKPANFLILLVLKEPRAAIVYLSVKEVHNLRFPQKIITTTGSDKLRLMKTG